MLSLAREYSTAAKGGGDMGLINIFVIHLGSGVRILMASVYFFFLSNEASHQLYKIRGTYNIIIYNIE